MLSLRKKIFIITGVSLGFLISILLVISLRNDWFDFGTPASDNAVEQTGLPAEETEGVVIPANKVITNPQAAAQTPDETWLKQHTRIFVERFGSYSNLADNSNIDDAIALSTDRMAVWLDAQRIAKDIQYQGVITRVLASAIESILDKKAVVSFGASQIIQTVNGDESPVFRSGFVNWVKVGNEWKADGFYWEE